MVISEDKPISSRPSFGAVDAVELAPCVGNKDRTKSRCTARAEPSSAPEDGRKLKGQSQPPGSDGT